MVLKPHDLVVVLHYALAGTVPMSLAGTGSLLGLSGAEVHAAIGRASHAGLMLADRKVAHQPIRFIVNRDAVVEFVVHGVRYVYVPERGPIVRGMPTAHGAEPLRRLVRTSGPVPVWPDAQGTEQGEAFSPLYKNAPLAARANPSIYKALALIDAIRGGRARERAAASKLFAELLQPGNQP